MFIVVNIPQSNLTPHLVGNMKRAYVRTGQSSRPEIIVHPEKLPWLLDNRRKSQNLRNILLDKAEAHFNNFLRSKFKTPETAPAAASISLVPLYPQTPLTAYKNMPDMADLIRFDCQTGPFPPINNLKTVQDGIIITLGETSAIELDAYGLMFYKTVLTNEEKYINPQKFYNAMMLFFKTAANFYFSLGFISPLMLRIKLSNARGTKIQTGSGDKMLIEDYIRIDKNISLMEMRANLAEFALPFLEEFAWAIDMPFKENEGLRVIENILQTFK
jgi:hypothetical protein